MSTLKKAKVVMLPTNEPSKIENLVTYQKRNLAKVIKEGINPKDSTVQFWNLYIISDDEIKLFDWVYNNKENIVEQITSKTQLIFVLEENKENQTFKKIIATTDESLYFKDTNKNPKQYMGSYISMSLGENLPQPSKQFIQKYIEEYNKGRQIIDIIVEYEEIIYNPEKEREYQSNDRIYIEDCDKQTRLKINYNDNTITIKKVKDSYTREEVEKLCKKAYKEGKNYDAPDQCVMSDKISIEEFIRQNL